MAVAFDPGVPSYTFMQNDGDEVECQRGLWDKMSYERKLNCVKEEMAVIAIERFIAPLYFDGDMRKASITRALRGAAYKLNTTLSSGWFRRFVVMNGYRAYSELIQDMSWFNRWIQKTESGEIKLTRKE